MKLKTTLALVLALVLALSSAAFAAGDFTDVADDAYYADAVAWALEKGVTDGMGEGIFAPDYTVTRAQAVTFLWRCLGCPAPTSARNPFTDVEAGSYYETAVRWAVEMGITTGVDEKHFAPDLEISRAQTVTFLHRAWKLGCEGFRSECTISGSDMFAEELPNRA